MKLLLASMLTNSQHKVAPLLEMWAIKSALCIPTAANVYSEKDRGWQSDEMNTLRQLGVELDVFDLDNKTVNEVEAKLAVHDAIYVTGGNTYYLMESMQYSGFDETIKEWIANERKLYIGCSAGAVAACPRIDYIGEMDDPSKSTLTKYKGLALYPNLVMVHADNPKYGPIGKDIMTKWRKEPSKIIPLNDDQALLWDGIQEQII